MGDIVIVGSGIAGHRAAAEISRLAPGRRVIVIGSEAGHPYDRPPLSKDFLLAEEALDPLLGPAGIYGANVVLRDCTAANAIDADDRTVSLSDGSWVGYGTLLLATGSRLRRLELPGVDERHVHYLRTLADARQLREALISRRRIVIIGGGFIGLEVAAAARSRGCDVTLFELAPGLLSRSATSVLGQFLAGLHASRGIRLVLGTRIDGAEQGANGIHLRWQDGEIEADDIVVGIGVLPNLELAASAGIATADGIVVDQSCRTSRPGIFAAGEVTNYPIGRLDVRMRTESWSAAAAQGEIAARAILGQQDARFTELPWFWSDQYETNVQCLGLPKTADQYLQIGEPSSGKWLRIGLDAEGGLVGAEGVNMGREISALRRADRTGQPVPTWLIDMAGADGEREADDTTPAYSVSTSS
jgi:3-phenylpropionate/trans-cinnamate dioxygenase ferredoxin reductase subunit/anthranilate 1,2-dioxygenase ferredoxin reductase subunit